MKALELRSDSDAGLFLVCDLLWRKARDEAAMTRRKTIKVADTTGYLHRDSRLVPLTVVFYLQKYVFTSVHACRMEFL